MNRLCQDINAMDKLNLAPLRISFNVAHEQFVAPNFVTKIESILSANKVSGSRFEFELAETDVIESLAAIATDMQQLEQRGIRFSLDDFGTGFSSLPQLQRLPITTLKLDKSHVQKVVNDQDSANMVRAMIYLAHALTLKVVAEGVETERQKDFLKENNCDQMQGFIFSEPLSFDDFTQLLRQQGATSRPSYLSIVDK
jgi:EAL domain-containing protein (putative c-di-GMP-specific phosphodiesterase class I)